MTITEMRQLLQSIEAEGRGDLPATTDGGVVEFTGEYRIEQRPGGPVVVFDHDMVSR